MRQLDKYFCRVKYRPLWHGKPVKESCRQLEGLVLKLETLWLMDDEYYYPNEWALGGADLESREALRKAGIAWIASGDVEVLEFIPWWRVEFRL